MNEQKPAENEEKLLLEKLSFPCPPYKIPEESEELDVKLVGSSFEIGWCEMCGGIFVLCPKNGNNNSNGGTEVD